jgi:16S rRNA (uracil1498-N3)-methyltransferase
VTGRPAREPAGAGAMAHVFVDALDDRLLITGADGHHLRRVRRLEPGELVTAADGSGAWRAYEVADLGNGELTLAAGGDVEHAPPPSIGVALAVALPKGGLDDVVAAVTELGAVRVIPVRTERTVVRWDAARAGRAVTRLRAVAREAAMQSRRARVPDVDDVVDLLALAGRPDLVVADREGVAAAMLPRPAPGAGVEWTALTGPEGGLAPEELAALSASPRLRLGPHVLRAATAPVAAVAVLVGETSRLLPE